MPNVNTAIRYLPGATANADVRALPFARKGNADFFAAVAAELARLPPGDATTPGFAGGGVGCIGLIGEYGLLGYGIRTAQEVLRVDRTPSHWSHAFLFATPLSTVPAVNRSPTKSPWVWESTLEPATAFNRFSDLNGVGPRRLGDYANAKFDPLAPHSVPNVAVIAIALTTTERAAIMDRANDPAVDRLRYDLSDLLGRWYAYLADTSDRPSPLAEGFGVYSAMYVQMAYEAAQIDLTLGGHQRNTSPEHLWQTAKYFGAKLAHYDAANGRVIPRAVYGWYCTRDETGSIAPAGAGTLLPKTLRGIVALAP